MRTLLHVEPLHFFVVTLKKTKTISNSLRSNSVFACELVAGSKPGLQNYPYNPVPIPKPPGQPILGMSIAPCGGAMTQQNLPTPEITFSRGKQ